MIDEETPREDEQPEGEAPETPEADESTVDSPQSTEAEPEAEQPAPEAEAPEAEQAPAEEAEAPAEEAEAPAEEAPADSGQPTADQAEERPPRERKPRGEGGGDKKPDVVPGAHLEPDLVLEEQAAAESEFPGYQEEAYEGQPESAGDGEGAAAPAGDGAPADAEAPRTPLDLAADARYHATGKRKTSVARVILRPGTGTYTINGRPLDEFFPRTTLQRTARQPLETAGYETRMDVVAKIHGGGVSAQAGALRHGVARALVEADPNLRGELKRHGFLTRDARAKERKKAGLKKARKRPQFSKR
jgi:small subunit ribosomal protein S9